MIEHMYPRGAFWPRHLEVVGSELFLRYRKRLMRPRISLEICRDYPGLSILDVMVRVHAGRQIIRDGDEFEALAQIRAGRWDTGKQLLQPDNDVPPGGDDPVSALLVRFGRGLFAAFFIVSLVAIVLTAFDMHGSPPRAVGIAAGTTFVLILLTRWLRRG